MHVLKLSCFLCAIFGFLFLSFLPPKLLFLSHPSFLEQQKKGKDWLMGLIFMIRTLSLFLITCFNVFVLFPYFNSFPQASRAVVYY